ncbi:dienelactone hydrolase family protein [Psychroflexus tropicus]|uniref:dienelactone hydrolase family protein n=1 Tax=Psychroflexus tropicus TaxID=197345 RepID=UPI00036945C3|nr:dienelactone hydrolase family protein [Psychroflexus tropicus]
MNGLKSLSFLFIAISLLSCKSEGEKASTKQVEQIQTEEVEIIGKEISYKSDSTVLRGYIAHNELIDQKRPGIIVVHEWWGHDEFAREKADELAEMGYVALAVDMYGEGKQANHPDEAMAFSSNVMKNFDTAKQRFMAAVETLKADKNVNPDQISAVGFCFGGSVALSMANAGVDLDAVAVFHSGLGLPVMPSEKLKAKLLIQNGAEDMMITDEQEKAFKNQLEAVNADYEYIAFDGVKHSFTNKDADSLAKKHDLPLAYDKEASEKSWENMTELFEKVYSN